MHRKGGGGGGGDTLPIVRQVILCGVPEQMNGVRSHTKSRRGRAAQNKR